MAACLVILSGCDDGRWREMQPPGMGLVVAMPCRPARLDRTGDLAGKPRGMALWSCALGQQTFAVLRVDASDPADVDAVMAAVVEAARQRMPGRERLESAGAVPGMTPHRLALDMQASGPMPDGQSRRWRTLIFRYGLSIYQASAIGAEGDAAWLDPFFRSVSVRP